MVSLEISAELDRRFRADVAGDAEGAGFFLAEYRVEHHAFGLFDWRAIPADGFETRGRYHLVLGDAQRVEIIRWAWGSGASLVEVHTHDLGGPAAFSMSDMSGLGEWLPHIWWRLRGRPYGAIVLDGEGFDGLAWVEGPDQAEQVDRIDVRGARSIPATGQTLAMHARWAGMER